MDRRSKHLSSEESGVILAEHDRGSSQRAIGRLLCRPASTIGRELARGRQGDGSYCPTAARNVYEVRRARCRRKLKLAEGERHCSSRSGAGWRARWRRSSHLAAMGVL